MEIDPERPKKPKERSNAKGFFIWIFAILGKRALVELELKAAPYARRRH